MRKKLPECAHCGATTPHVKPYWSDRNLAKVLLKTNYCDHCAKIIVPRQMPVDPKLT